MSKFDPKLFSTGIGAAAGATVLSEDGNPLSIIAGTAIGATVGLAGNFTVPSYESMTAVNQGLPTPKQATSSLTLNKIKSDLIDKANAIVDTSTSVFTPATSNPSFIQPYKGYKYQGFDPSAPFTTLNRGNFEDFTKHVNGISDVLDLKRLSLNLSQKSDSIGINSSAIKLAPSQSIRSMTISENTSAKGRASAFKDYLKTLGYTDQAAIDAKAAQFSTLLNRPGAIVLKEGRMTIPGVPTALNLYGPIAGDPNVKAHIRGNIVNTSRDINVLGDATLKKMSVKAVADALGIVSADAFNIQAMLKNTEGLSPDEVVAMMSKSGLSDEQLNTLVQDLNKMGQYDAKLSGEMGQHGDRRKLELAEYHRNLQGQTSFGFSANFDSNGAIDTSMPFRKLKSTSDDAKVLSELTTLKRSKMLHTPNGAELFHGIKADHADVLGNSKYPRGISNVNFPSERNSSAATRPHVTTENSKGLLATAAEDLIEGLGWRGQFGDSVGFTRLTVDPDKVNPMSAKVFGGDYALAEGFGIANKNKTDNLTITEQRVFSILADKDGNFNIPNQTVQKVLSGKDKKKQSLADVINLKDTRLGADEVVGFSSDYQEVRTKQDFDSYELKDVKVVNEDGAPKRVDLIYEGSMTVGDQPVSKLFSVDAKVQIKNSDSDTFSKFAVFSKMVSDDVIQDTGSGFSISGGKPISYGKFRRATAEPGVEGFKRLFPKAMQQNVESTLKRYKSGVDLVQGEGDAGIAVANSLRESLAKGTQEGAKKQVSDNIFDALLANKVQGVNEEALVKLGTALTTNKSSAVVLLEGFAQARATGDRLLNTAEQNRQHFDSFEKFATGLGLPTSAEYTDYKTSVFTNGPNAESKQKGALAVAKFQQDFMQFAQEKSKVFSDPGMMLKSFADNPNQFVKDLLPIFQHLNGTGDTSKGLSYTSVSIERRNEGVLGSSSTRKEMSWGAQLQLQYSGLSKEDLDLFGHFEQGRLADLTGILSSTKVAEESINSQVTLRNASGVARAIKVTGEQRRQALADVGVNIEGPYGHYNLQTELPDTKIKSLPIFLENTTTFGTYFNKNTGEMETPKLFGMVSRIMERDLKLQNPNLTKTEKDLHTEELKKGVDELDKYFTKTMFSGDALYKTVQNRTASRSMYSNVNPATGVLDKLVKASVGAGGSASFAAVSTGGAVARLQAAGIDVKDADDLMKNYTQLVDVNGVKVRKLKASGKQDFFSILAREPTVGPGSVRKLEYIVDDTINPESKALHLSAKDKLWSLLQLGDFDADHSPEFFPNFKNKGKTADVYAKLKTIDAGLQPLVNYAEALDLKAGNSKVGSMLDLLDGPNAPKTHADLLDKYMDSVFQGNEKGGLRKRVAPTITMLSAAINDSLAAGIQDQSALGGARLLSHYLVEGSIKSIHTAGDMSGTSIAERLADSRKRYIKDGTGDYLNLLKTQLNSMANWDKLRDAGLEDFHKASVENILQAERLATKELTNTMGLGWGKGKSIGEWAPAVEDVLTGKHATKTVLPTEDVETPVADSFKDKYNTVKQSIKKNVVQNKKVLGLGAAALIGTALLTQKGPDFRGAHAEANPNKMMLAGQEKTSQDVQDTGRTTPEGYSFSTAASYLAPEGLRKQSVEIEGSYNPEGDIQNSMRNSFYGNSIDSARVESY